MKTATHIKDVRRAKNAEVTVTQKLYRMDPPLKHWDRQSKYVVASRVVRRYPTPAFPRYETYLFPARANGKITELIELPQSSKGKFTCEQAIRNAGYTIAK